MEPIGRRRWAIAEGYIPAWSHGPQELISHETACVLNAGDADAHVTLTAFFTDREPIGPYAITVPARRTVHVRLDRLESPARIPRATDYSVVIESDVPVVVQHTRIDTRQPENALMTTMAFGAD